MATEPQNKQKERLIAKLVDIKRKPKVIIKTDKTTGENIEYFYASCICNGKQQQITSKSLSDFVEKVDSVLFQLSNPELGDNAKTPLPIKDAFNIYLQEIRFPKLKEYTEERRKRNYRQDFNSVGFVYRFFENKKIEYFHQIDDTAVQSLKYHLIHERKNAVASFNRRLVILTSLNKYLQGYTNYKPSECNFLKYKCQENNDLTNYLNDTQVQNLLEASPLHLKRLIQFFLYTGMRKQNGLDLKWSEIDFENRQITVQIK